MPATDHFPGRSARLQFGAPAWLDQHDAVDQLNLQAHLNAQAHADEFVKEALVLHDKLGLLVRELLAAEVGAARCVPPGVPRGPRRGHNAALVPRWTGGCRPAQAPTCTVRHLRACPWPRPPGRQVWRERLLPLLERHLAERVDSVTAYQLLCHEASLANLLEVGRQRAPDRACQHCCAVGWAHRPIGWPPPLAPQR